MVGRSIQNQTVGILQLHTGNHTTHLLTSGEYIHLLQHLLAAKEHTTQELLEVNLVALAELSQPVNQVQLALEELRIVQWQIGRGDGNAPVVGSCLSLAVAVDNLKEGCHSSGVVTQEYHLVTLLYGEADIVKQDCSVLHGSLQAFHLQNLVTRFALHLEDNAGILSGRRLDFLHVQLLQHLLSAGSLLTLGHIGRESADELLQLLLLLLGLSLLVLSLTQR